MMKSEVKRMMYELATKKQAVETARRELFEAQYDAVKALADDRQYDLLEINWSRLRRYASSDFE